VKHSIPLILLSLFLLSAELIGEEGKIRRHELSTNLGIVQLVLKDDLSSPMRYSGDASTYFIRHSLAIWNGVHTVSLFYDTGKLTSSISIANRSYESFHRFRITGGYSRGVIKFLDGNAVLFLGFLSDNQFIRREHIYINTTSELIFEFYTSLGPSLSVSYLPAPRHRLGAGLHGSVFAYIFRSPYAVKGNMQGTLQAFGSFRQLSTEVRYGYLIFPNVTVDVSYHFNFYSHTFPRITSYESGVIILSAGVRL
jgi:hypothetical protein